MSDNKWKVNLIIYRKRADKTAYYQSFTIKADPEEYVLDLVERIWAFHDRTLTFKHACHHSTCGACGMLVNGKEKLTCITPVKTVTHNGGEIKIEPLRNFPVISDLVVDFGEFFQRMEKAEFNQVAQITDACLPFEKKHQHQNGYERLVDCIECGLCVSACPAASTNKDYLGPAVLAAVHHSHKISWKGSLLNIADSQNGVWRCHSAFECSEVCPSNTDPGWRIMDLRKNIFQGKITNLIGRKNKG
jgi:succinate dehydrogenase / fumarate reductase iron-sulfur subunit